MKMTCDICKKSAEGTEHWLGDMSRFRPIKPDEYKWSGMRTIIICDDCFQKHINGKEAENDLQRPTGEWIIDGHHRRCKKCDEYFCMADSEGNEIPSNFCPNCGADMRKG